MKNYPCCIVVADGSRARFFSSTGRYQPLILTESHDNAAARLKTRELVTDAPGKTQTSDPLSSPGEIEEDRFAKRLASLLTRQGHEGRFKSLVLVASPRFLGTLRGELPRAIRQCVSLELAKNWTSCRAETIQDRLRHVEAPPSLNAAA